jgi:pimeloyl-ACP methyl ester carboxylesterase
MPPWALNIPGLLGLLAAGLVLGIGIMVAWTATVLARPPRRTYASSLAKGLPGDPSELREGPRAFDSWTLDRSGVTLQTWQIAGDDPSGPLIVLTHGWGSSRIGALTRLGPLLPRASAVVAWDMRGHGESGGCCTHGVHEVDDLLALIDRVGGDRPIVLMGWSLGAGVSIAAASRLPRVVGVIAECPYRLVRTPAINMMIAMGMPWRLNLGPALRLLGLIQRCPGLGRGQGPFDRAADASRLTCPVLVLHGTADPISPLDDGRAVASAAPRGRLVEITDGGHSGMWVDPATAPACEEAVATFLDGLRRDA